MRFALDQNNNRVHVDSADPKESYFCPTCGEKLVLKKGEIRVHHFAHPANSKCLDNWDYDMSDWHVHWQEQFPHDSQEVVKERDGKKHRADVLLEDCKTVIEFQHSPLKPSEFAERNRFYNSLGYKVVWIFDVIEAYANYSLRNIKNGWLDKNGWQKGWRWSRPRSSFHGFCPQESDVVLFLQLFCEPQDDERLQKIIEGGKKPERGSGRWMGEENKRYYVRHAHEHTKLIKVINAKENLKEFLSDEKEYSLGEFKAALPSLTTLRYQFALKELFDVLKRSWLWKQGRLVYEGCPISPNNTCIPRASNWDRTLPKEVPICSFCKFIGPEEATCKKRFAELNIPENALFLSVVKNEGFVHSISYTLGGEEKNIQFGTRFPKKKTVGNLFDLWRENDLSAGFFRHVKSGWYLYMERSPFVTWNKYHRVYGIFFQHPGSLIDGLSKEVHGANEPVWEYIGESIDDLEVD